MLHSEIRRLALMCSTVIRLGGVALAADSSIPEASWPRDMCERFCLESLRGCLKEIPTVAFIHENYPAGDQDEMIERSERRRANCRATFQHCSIASKHCQ